MDRLRELILERFREKSIVLLGYGREGQSTYRLLREIFPGKELVIADRREEIRNDPSFGYDRHLQFITGAGYMDRLDGFDAVFRSPGIPVWQLLTGASGQPAGNGKTGNRIEPDKITSQTSLFLECYAGQVIGVTGTKGKSTTSSLVHHLFKVAGKETLLAGNIGNPVFHIAHLVTPSTTVVLELSSHQLEFLTRSPHTAILLNLYQEHLDAYADYESYQRAKANIARYQQEGDFLIWNADDERVNRQLAPYLPYRRSFPFSLSDRPLNGGYPADGGLVFSDGGRAEEIWKIHQDRFLRGDHNLRNILAASLAALLNGLPAEEIGEGIETFKGLEHRLEYVGEFRGIHFYNDSIATIPEACMEAIRAIPDVDTLVAGGFDRGIDYSELAGFLSRSDVKNIILVGKAGIRIGECMEGMDMQGKQIYRVERFDDFAPIAIRETRPGKACLLSPAAASYDEFNNFEERGKRYRELVRLV